MLSPKGSCFLPGPPEYRDGIVNTSIILHNAAQGGRLRDHVAGPLPVCVSCPVPGCQWVRGRLLQFPGSMRYGKAYRNAIENTGHAVCYILTTPISLCRGSLSMSVMFAPQMLGHLILSFSKQWWKDVIVSYVRMKGQTCRCLPSRN